MNESSQLSLVERVRSWIPLGLVLVTVLLVYSRVIDAPFLWDDRPLLESSAIQSLDYPWRYLYVSFWNPVDERAKLFYRPAVTFSLAIDRAIHGNNASGYHLTNLALHSTAVVLVYVLARRHRAAPPAAALAAALFGLFPRLTESVAWIAGRTDALCAVFALGAWVAYERGSFPRLLGASVLAYFALLSKESGIAVVFAIVVSELYPWPTKPALKRLAPLFALTALYLLTRAETLQNARVIAIPLTPGERALTILEAIGRYAFMALDPWQPRSQIGVVKSPVFGFVVLGGLVAIGIGVGLWKTRRSWTRPRFFAGVLILLPLLLVVHFIPMPWLAVAGDRLLYLPLAAFAAIAAPALGRIFPSRVAPSAALGALALSFAVTTYRVSGLYLDSAEFWVTAVETTPHENFGPSFDLAAEFSRAGLYDEALVIITSVEQRRDVTGVQVGVNFTHLSVLSSVGRYAEVKALLDTTKPGKSPDLDLARARVLASLGRVEEARTLTADIVERYPKLSDATRFRRQLQRLDEERRALAAAPAGSLERAVLQARIELRSARRAEAARAWLALLAHPRATQAVIDEGMTFLVTFGSFQDVTRAAELYRHRGGLDAVLVMNLVERRQTAERLLGFRPRIESALGVQFPR